MADSRRQASLTERAGAAAGRALRRTADAWSALDLHQRLAAVAAIVLPLTMLAPWFQVTGETTAGRIVSYTLTGFGSFGWVETALLLVCGGIVWMLFARGENRAFHLPGGDGSIVTFGGIWCLGLLVWRILFNKPHPTLGTETGIDWGVMAALAAATLMLGAGLRLKAEHLAEPPIIFPEDRDTGQLTLDGSPSKPVIPAPESDPEPADDVDPTIAQLTMQLPDEPRRRRRTRRRPQD